MINKIINNKLFNPRVLIGFIVFLMAFKVTGDAFFYIFSLLESVYFVSWKISISVVITALLWIYFEAGRNRVLKDDKIIPNEAYSSDLKILLMLMIILLVSTFLLPSRLIFSFGIDSFLEFTFIEAISLYSVIFSFYFINFEYKWILVRKHKRTETYLSVSSFLLILMLFRDLISHFLQYPDSELAGFSSVASPLISLSIVFIAFFMSQKNKWIAYLPGGRKWKLIGASIAMIVLSSIVFSLSYDSNNEGRLYNSLMVFFGAGSLLQYPALISIGYFSRVLLVTLFALPTTKIVEQRSYELSSLTYLNRVVASTSNINQLLDTVTNLAMGSSGANSAWTEIYGKGEQVTIASKINIDEEIIKNFHSKSNIRNYFISLKEPLFIETVKDCSEKLLTDICVILNSKSLIAIPLFAGEDRIGTLIVLHPDEYSFERDYINLLSAFSDNINVALENTRLFNESLEKEKYKKELMLAKEIEAKLLPQKLPQLKNYSVDAFTVAAYEVGGDYYDMLELKNGKYCILIGDVSGKGMSAAFYMALLKGVVLALAKESESPGELLSKINATLYGAMEKRMYITLSAIMIVNDEGLLKYSRAGHTPAIVRSGGKINSFQPKGIGIGLANSNLFDSVIEEIDICLEVEDALLLYTDGIIEIRNSENNEFDENYLKQILNFSVYNNANELVNLIKEKMDIFSGSKETNDDMTILALHYKKSN